MDPADYFEDEEELMEIEGGLGPEAELASATEVARGEVGGGVLSQVRWAEAWWPSWRRRWWAPLPGPSGPSWASYW